MNCPDEPDNTCPLIDRVLESVKKADNAYDTLNEIDFKLVKDELEEIRNANSDLRERAQFFESQAGEFEEEKDKAIKRAEEAEARIAELERDLSIAAVQPGA